MWFEKKNTFTLTTMKPLTNEYPIREKKRGRKFNIKFTPCVSYDLG